MVRGEAASVQRLRRIENSNFFVSRLCRKQPATSTRQMCVEILVRFIRVSDPISIINSNRRRLRIDTLRVRACERHDFDAIMSGIRERDQGRARLSLSLC